MTAHACGLHRSIALAAVLALLAGCASKNTAPPAPGFERLEPTVTVVFPRDPGPPDPLAQRLCTVLHELPLARRAQCCGAPPTQSLASECVRTLTTSLTSGAARIEPEALARCEREAAQALDGCDWVTPLVPPAPAACAELIEGTREEGDECRSALECGEGLFCRGLTSTVLGTCTAAAAAGAACGASVDTLVTYTRQDDVEEHHSSCLGYCQGNRCADSVAVGGACLGNHQCVRGSRCSAGKCVVAPLPSAGQPCDSSGCAPGAACVSGKCAARKEAGKPCTAPFECRASCVKPPTAARGVCGMQCPGGTLVPAVNPSAP